MDLQSQIMSQEIVIKSTFPDCDVAGNLSNSLLCLYNFGFKVLDSAYTALTLFHMLMMEMPAELCCTVALFNSINCNNEYRLLCFKICCDQNVYLCLQCCI